MAKISRSQIVKFARELGFPFPSPETNRLIDEAQASADPQLFLRVAKGVAGEQQAAAELACGTSAGTSAEEPAGTDQPSAESVPSESFAADSPPAGTAAECCGQDLPPMAMVLTPIGNGECIYRTALESVLQSHLAAAAPGYKTQRLDVRLDEPSRTFMARLLAGLNRKAARLANGKFVQNANDAVRWLIEQCHIATEGE